LHLSPSVTSNTKSDLSAMPSHSFATPFHGVENEYNEQE